MQPTEEVGLGEFGIEPLCSAGAPDHIEDLQERGSGVPIRGEGDAAHHGRVHAFRQVSLIPSAPDFEAEGQGSGQVHGPRSGAPPRAVIADVPSRQGHRKQGPFFGQPRGFEEGFHGGAGPVGLGFDQLKPPHAILQQPLQGLIGMVLRAGEGFEFGHQLLSPRTARGPIGDPKFGGAGSEDAARFERLQFSHPSVGFEVRHHTRPPCEVWLRTHAVAGHQQGRQHKDRHGARDYQHFRTRRWRGPALP